MLHNMRVFDNMGMLCNMRVLDATSMSYSDQHHKENSVKFHLINALGLVGLNLINEQPGEGKTNPYYVFLDRVTGDRYVCEVKEVRDGRADRVIPQFAMAIIQSARYAQLHGGSKPLAVVFVSNIVPSLVRQFREFADEFAKSTDLALVAEDGAHLVRLRGLWLHHESLDPYLNQPVVRRHLAGHGASSPVTFNPFSDLNQWMVKILIARHLPAELIGAPRERIYSGAQLARLAKVSPMSATRLLNHLRKEQFLVDGPEGLDLARREDFLQLWRAAHSAFPSEIGMRFLVRVAMKTQFESLKNAITSQRCLGLFSAAESLGMGHVSGTPPYLIMPRLPVLEANRPEWQMTDVCKEGNSPDFIVRRTMTPIATFKAAVSPNGVPCTDVIQTWLDVSSHPTRGAEQADHIYKTVLKPFFERSP